MACGLPIISSNREFNYDILSEDNAILIDPENVESIKDAIIKLMKSEELRYNLSKNSMKIAENLTIKKRASDILNWMGSIIG